MGGMCPVSMLCSMSRSLNTKRFVPWVCRQQQLIRAYCFAALVKAASKHCRCLSPNPMCAANALTELS